MSKLCDKCDQSFSGFGSTCGSCRKGGDGVAIFCEKCHCCFVGYGTLCQDCKTSCPSELELEVTAWIEAVSGEKRGGRPFGDWLADGQLLCRVANKIKPGVVPKVNTSTMPFKKMENITSFINACRHFGVLEKDTFSTVDLSEQKNLKAVMFCVAALGGIIRHSAPEFKGPYCGVKQNAHVEDAKRPGSSAIGVTGFRRDIGVEVREEKGLQRRPVEASAAAPTAAPAPVAPAPPREPQPQSPRPQPPRLPQQIKPAEKPRSQPTTPRQQQHLQQQQQQAEKASKPTSIEAVTYGSHRGSCGVASLEREVTEWLEAVSGEQRGERGFWEWLENGQLLCDVANRIEPNSIPKINKSTMPFKKMENITSFIKACRKLGVMEKDVFSTVDLAEQKNLLAVMRCIYNLGSVIRSTAPCFNGPYLGHEQKSRIKNDGPRMKLTPGEIASGGLLRDVAGDIRYQNLSARHM